ncbi:MFS transporter [Burkholderia multivorans]|nr:MFS transporter [Burkholderia multivorans]
MSHTLSPASGLATPERYRHRWLVFAVMLAGEAMDVLNMTIANVAAPSLERDFGASATQLQWAIGGYGLAMGACLVVGARFGDVYGRRRMFLTAMSVFALASLLCAVAPGINALIAARFLQGAAGALLLPQGFALLRETFEPDELGKAMAFFGPVMGIAGIIGPSIGGGIIQADILALGWRPAFAINLPITCIALAIGARVLPHDRRDLLVGSIDVTGAVLMALASGLLVLPLIQGQATGWPAWTWASFAASATCFVLFAIQQRSQVVHHRVPLVDPGIFAKPAFSAGLVAMALIFSAQIGGQFVFTLFLQLGNGFSAGKAGLAALPHAFGAIIGSAVAGGFLLERIGKRVLQLGAWLHIGALAWLWAILPAQGSTPWHLLPAFVFMGAGSGMIMASLITIVISAVDAHEAGSGSGMLAVVQAIASSAGIAGLGGLFFTRFEHGHAIGAYQSALAGQALLLAGFLLATLALPTRFHPATSH